jgi:thiol-disulfide isomerase/thioredoxin
VTGGLIASLIALGAATACGLYYKARNGRIVSRGQPGGRDHAAGDPLTSSDLGAPLGRRATLVQFSSAFCAPCRATRRILSDVAGMVDGVTHVEIDAESRLDLVRRLDVRRTPTTFVLDPDGLVIHRASGQPRKAEVIAALGAVV